MACERDGRSLRPRHGTDLARHGGAVLGYLDTLSADGPDLHFSGHVNAELGPGSLPVSIETQLMAPARGAQRAITIDALIAQRPAFRGVLRWNVNLVGVALSDRPAAPGSVLWVVTAPTGRAGSGR